MRGHQTTISRSPCRRSPTAASASVGNGKHFLVRLAFWIAGNRLLDLMLGSRRLSSDSIAWMALHVCGNLHKAHCP